MSEANPNEDGKLIPPCGTTAEDSPDYLRRLRPELYQGRAFVHWTMTIEGRRRCWLDALFHARWREILLHATIRYHLVCPAYVLMPDHWHVLLIGTHEQSDQRKAVKFLREQAGRQLCERNCELQKQAYDHILREKDRARDAFTTVAQYILANPQRGNLVEDWKGYPHSGAIVPGYPSLDARDDRFWDRFWAIHEKLTSAP